MDEPATAKRRDWLVPAALVLLASLVRELRWLQTAVMMNDGPEFIRLAERISAGDWAAALAHKYHPGYPAAIAAAHALTPDWERAAAWVSVLAGGLAVLGLYLLLREGFGRRVAVVGGFLLAVHPVAIEMTDVQSDPLYLALFLASAACLLRAHLGGSVGAALGAGALAGCAYLVRPEGMGMVLVGLALAAFEVARRHWAVSLRLAAPLCIGAALAMAPYVTALSIQAGELSLTQKKSVASLLGLSSEERVQKPRPLDPLLVGRDDLEPLPRGVKAFRAKAVPSGAATLPFAASQVLRESTKALRPEGVLLLALGLFAARGRPGRRGRFFAASIALYLAVLFGLAATQGYLSRRHVFPPVTLLFGYEAMGVLVLVELLARMRALAPLPAVRAAIPLALIAALGLGKSLRPDRLDALPERQAAEWIKSDGALAPDEAVAGIKQRIAYYAGARWIDLRWTPHPGVLIEYLRRERVRYVVVDEREREELLRLAAKTPDALVERRRLDLGGHSAFVFELRS